MSSWQHEKKWREKVRVANQILDQEINSKWDLADILVELIPDGTSDVRKHLKRFYEETGNRLKLATLTTYRETALAWPVETRIEDKGFWAHAQARSHKRRQEIVAVARDEFHLRDLLGHRNPYRVRWPRIQNELRNLENARAVITPELIRLWLSDSEIRMRFIDELNVNHGVTHKPFEYLDTKKIKYIV